MKKIFAALFFLQSLLAGGQDTTFLDNDYLKVASMQQAAYFKIVSFNKADTNRATETVYFRAGSLKTQRDYAVYKTRKLDGKVKEWFENGQIRKDIDYKGGKKSGKLFTYWQNGKQKRADTYEDDELIEGKCMKADGTDTLHYAYEKLPEFPGGINALRQYLSKTIKYPKVASRIGMEGKVLVGFMVNKNGDISNSTIIQSISDELDEEAMRVIKRMPKWEPGMEDGELVRVSFILPIHFKLQ